MARAYSTVLKEIAEVKEARSEALRRHMPQDTDGMDAREVRMGTLRAQGHDDVVAYDVQLEELRAEQRAHEDHEAHAASWGTNDHEEGE